MAGLRFDNHFITALLFTKDLAASTSEAMKNVLMAQMLAGSQRSMVLVLAYFLALRGARARKGFVPKRNE